MGAGRSIDKVADQQGSKTGSRASRYLEWSRKYGWVESARQYDEQVAYLTVNEAAQQYQDDLADYRKRYGDMGKGLWQAAAVLTRRLTKEAATMELTPATLTLVANAAKTAADLEALALRIEGFLNEPRSE
jgi:hypothetical protein